MKKFLMVTVAIAAVLSVVNDPAHAMQTEISQRKIQQMREGLARWNRKVERMERLEAKRAAAEAERESDLQSEPENASEPAAASYSGGVLSQGQVESYLRGAGFPESVISTMVAIIWRESRFDPNAVNGSSGACGLAQLFPCPGPEAFNPATNLVYAYAKYQAAGLSPWGM